MHVKKSFADFITKHGQESSQGITDQGPVKKSGRRRTERAHPPLQALALLKDHQEPLSLAETELDEIF